MITFHCHHCGVKIEADTNLAGQVSRCPCCRNSVAVPLPTALEEIPIPLVSDELDIFPSPPLEKLQKPRRTKPKQEAIPSWGSPVIMIFIAFLAAIFLFASGVGYSSILVLVAALFASFPDKTALFYRKSRPFLPLIVIFGILGTLLYLGESGKKQIKNRPRTAREIEHEKREAAYEIADIARKNSSYGDYYIPPSSTGRLPLEAYRLEALDVARFYEEETGKTMSEYQIIEIQAMMKAAEDAN